MTREAGDYLSAEQILEIETISAAHAIGHADRIGSLEVGKRADLVIRRNDIADAQPGLHPIQEAVLISRSKSVHTVIVDGRIVLRAGRTTRVDEGAVYAESRTAARRMADRIGLSPGTSWPSVA